MASKRDIWLHEFLGHFLGITDFSVLSVLESDYATVMRSVRISKQIPQNKSVATFETP